MFFLVQINNNNTFTKFFAESLSNYFANKDNREVSKLTLYNYLEYMTNAMLVNKVNRYDIRCKRILNGKYKYKNLNNKII